MTPRDDVEQFSDARTRRGKALGVGVGAALLGAFAFQVSLNVTAFTSIFLIFALLGVLACVVGVARAFRVGFTLDDHGVTVRTVASTRSWPWEDIRGARSYDRTKWSRTLGVVPARGTDDRVQILPILDLNSGKTVLLYGLRIQSHSSAWFNWVDDAVTAINKRLEERRGGPSSGDSSLPRPS